MGLTRFSGRVSERTYATDPAFLLLSVAKLEIDVSLAQPHKRFEMPRPHAPNSLATPDSSQLFVRLWNTVASREDAAVRENFFTECVAGVIASDQVFARDIARLLNGGQDVIGRTSISRARVTVTPQYPCLSHGRQCFIDLLVRIGDKVMVGVEVKLDAPEGALPSGDRQLRKYVEVRELTHVAYVTGYHTSVEPRVLASKRYLHHRRGHFLWSDFYSLIAKASKRRSAPQLHLALLKLFHSRHFEPMHPDLPDLATPQGRESFRALWTTTRKALSAHYPWVGTPRSTGELYTYDGESESAWKIGFDPARNPGLLRIWIYMATKRAREDGVEALERVFDEYPRMFQGAIAERRDGKGHSKFCISVWIPFRSLFPRRSSTASKEKRLALAAVRIVTAAI